MRHDGQIDKCICFTIVALWGNVSVLYELCRLWAKANDPFALDLVDLRKK